MIAAPVGEIPPQPTPDPDSIGFWEATARGELAMCHCQSCGDWAHPPLERCRLCAGPMAFDVIAGTGVLHSFIVVRYPAVIGFLGNLPYIVGLVEFDEHPGLRLSARVVGSEPEEMEVGQRVWSEIVPLPGGPYHVPVFHVTTG